MMEVKIQQPGGSAWGATGEGEAARGGGFWGWESRGPQGRQVADGEQHGERTGVKHKAL